MDEPKATLGALAQAIDQALTWKSRAERAEELVRDFAWALKDGAVNLGELEAEDLRERAREAGILEE